MRKCSGLVLVAASCCVLVSLLLMITLDTLTCQRAGGIHHDSLTSCGQPPRNPYHINVTQRLKEPVVINYPKFNMTKPRFIRGGDHEDAFLRSPANRDLLGVSGPECCRGRVAIIPAAIIHEKADCGFATTDDRFSAQRPFGTVARTTFHIVCPLLVPQSDAFQHFIDGVLPKLMQAWEYLNSPEVTLMLYRPRDAINAQLLRHFRIPETRVFYYNHDSYYSADYVINTCQTPPMHPALLRKAHELLFHKPNENATKVILLLRKAARNGGRDILNEEEVISFLRTIFKSDLLVLERHANLSRTRDTFSKAKIIIGVHGGAMYNAIFASKQTAIIELMPTNFTTGAPVPPHLAHTIIWQIAAMLGQPYWRLPLRPLNDRGDVIVSTRDLHEILAQTGMDEAKR